MAIDERFNRLGLLLSEEEIGRLNNSAVMVVGVGGVGAMAAEALARSAVGTIILVDKDEVETSNLNRQILATEDKIGQKKVDVMKERLLSINPRCHVIAYDCFFDGTKEEIFGQKTDFVIDAIDTITSKLDLIEICQKKGIRIISSLGMGNRMDPSQLRYTTLDKTQDDPLARAMRQIARKREMNLKVPVVISIEKPVIQNKVTNEDGKTSKEKTPVSSSAFVPNAAGLLLASYTVRELIK